MPIPPLPLELVALILDHLADDLSPPECRQHGAVVALVCKSWASLGVEFAFRDLQLKRGEDDELVDMLLRHPEWLSKIKSLVIKDLPPVEEGEPDHDTSDLPALVKICGRCTRVTTLSLEAFSQCQILAAIVASPCAPTLTALYTALAYSDESVPFSLQHLCDTLSSFPSLALLDLRIGNFCATTGDMSLVLPSSSHRLPIINLSLDLISPMQPDALPEITRLLGAVLDPSTLKHVRIGEWELNGEFLEWFSGCPNLATLAFVASSLALVAQLGDICNVVSRLTALKSLFINSNSLRAIAEERDAPASSVSFSTLADALPSSLCEACIAGVKVCVDFSMFEPIEMSKERLAESQSGLLLLVTVFEGDDPEQESSLRPFLRRSEADQLRWYLPVVRSPFRRLSQPKLTDLDSFPSYPPLPHPPLHSHPPANISSLTPHTSSISPHLLRRSRTSGEVAATTWTTARRGSVRAELRKRRRRSRRGVRMFRRRRSN